MGAGAGVCIFVFVYYDPHNARHVHEIDEATAMPQAIRLARWATGLSKGCSEAADRTRSVAQRRVLGFRCGVLCVAVRIRVRIQSEGPPILSALPTVWKEDRIGQGQAAIAASLRSAVWRYHAVRRSAAVLLTAPVHCAFVPTGMVLWGFIRRAALRCVEWWRLLMARVGAAAARGLVAPTGATC
jgi:hypothetical protein